MDEQVGVRIEGARIRKSRFTDIEGRHVLLIDADIRGALVQGCKLSGVEMVDVELTGDFERVTVNGVEIGPLIEAELDRRMPLRAKMRAIDADGAREAWSIVAGLWDETIEHARAMPPDLLHESVDGEWSFIETIRHLDFAMAAWNDRMIRGVESPWHPLDLPWDEAPGWDGIPWDRDARPTLDDVLAVRAERVASVTDVVDALTDERWADDVSMTAPGWPQIESIPVRTCLSIILNEHWEHRRYAERDLAALRA